MVRKSRGTYEGSELSRVHGGDKFKTSTEHSVEEVLGAPEATEDSAFPGIHHFIKNEAAWRRHYEKHPQTPDPRPVFDIPKNIDYAALAEEKVLDPRPEYIVDPTQYSSKEFETKVLETELFTKHVGHTLDTVFNTAKLRWEEVGPFPDIKYVCWLAQHPDKVPAKLKDGRTYFVPGSLIRTPEGGWHALCCEWDTDTKQLIPYTARFTLNTMRWKEASRMMFFKRDTPAI